MSVRFRRPDRHVRGFTLVELMVVVAIIAVVSAFAVPSYLRYGFRARRADAHQTLLSVTMAQERYYAVNNHYATSMTDLGFKEATSDKGYYKITLRTDAKGTWFNASATPMPGGFQAKDGCLAMDTNDPGQKTFRGHTTNGSCLW